MNFVWPITVLYFGPAGLWGYFKSGPKMAEQHNNQMRQAQKESEPTREQVGGCDDAL